MKSKTLFFSLRLNPNEMDRLNRLAKETARTRGGVIRRLLQLADLPEAKKLLGDEPKPPEAPNETKT